MEDLYTYGEFVGADSIRNMYKRRTVTYLLGEDDNDPNSSSLDTSCEGLLQGAERYERGGVFFNYLQHYYGNSITENHEFLSVPNVGHSSFEVYNSTQGNYALFEKPLTPSCDNLVSVNPIPNDAQIDIFPNPVTDILNISVIPFSNKNYKSLIFDLQGRLMMTQNIQAKDQLNISTLNNGMYFLHLEAGGKRVYKKFVVEK